MPTSFSWTLTPTTPTPPAPVPETPSTALSFGSVAYARQLRHLLPPGVLLKLEAGSVITRLLEAVADELARVNARSADLLNESDPRTATETLAEWEAMLSLPDESIPVIPGTDAERRVAITQKLASRGGQSVAFFQTLCAACGYTLTSITLYAEALLRAGFRVGDRCYDQVYAYSMLLELGAVAPGALSQPDFEAVVRKATHAHITTAFIYAP